MMKMSSRKLSKLLESNKNTTCPNPQEFGSHRRGLHILSSHIEQNKAKCQQYLNVTNNMTMILESLMNQDKTNPNPI